MPDPDRPRPASTVLLLRAGGDGLEVYLVRRHGRSGFMAGAHVFPGGRVDAADRELASLLPAETVASLRLVGIDDPLDAAAYWIAAVRETAEECGVLLTRTRDGAWASADTAEEVFAALRAGASFAETLDRHRLIPDVSGLHAFSWWITPEAEPKRYDTRFFYVSAPADHRASVDAHEVTEGDWMTPSDALARYRAGEIVLAPPTLVSLEDIADAATPDEVASLIPDPGKPVCPHLTHEDGDLVLALPGDPLHDVREAVWPGVRTRIVRDADGRFMSGTAA